MDISSEGVTELQTLGSAMKHSDLVQICLPTRNGERHLACALESLLGQTHTSLEIVVVDNASTDRTPLIAREFSRRDSRVRYVRADEFVCATDNWKRAFAFVDPKRSDFFMWASDDDRWSPNYLETLLAPMMTDTSSVLSYSQFDVIDDAGKKTSTHGYRRGYPHGGKFRRVRSIINSGEYSAIYGIIRLSAIDWRPCLTDVSFGADLWFLLQLAARGPFHITLQPLFEKRTGGISSSCDDPSASRNPRDVWNIAAPEWALISRLHVPLPVKCYIFARLKISAKLLYPQKRLHWLLMPWMVVAKLRANHQAFGIRRKLRAVFRARHG